MNWPWSKKKTEHRASGYSADRLAALVSYYNQTTGNIQGHAALEASCAIIGRAMSACTVQCASLTMRPSDLNLVGRQLIRGGEIVFCIMTDGSAVSLVPASTWNILGNYDRSKWVYRLELSGAYGFEHVNARAESVLHIQYAFSPDAPWDGRGPLEAAFETSKLAGTLENRLALEMTAPVGQVLPWPESKADVDTEEDDPLDDLRKDIASLKGNVAVVSTTAGGLGDRMAAPHGDWSLKRIGAAPPEILERLRTSSASSVYAACGIPQSLVSAGADANSTREGARFLHANVINPLLGLLAEELEKKLESPVTVRNPGLFHADLQARTRAIKTMTDAGYSKDEISRILEVPGA